MAFDARTACAGKDGRAGSVRPAVSPPGQVSAQPPRLGMHATRGMRLIHGFTCIPMNGCMPLPWRRLPGPGRAGWICHLALHASAVKGCAQGGRSNSKRGLWQGAGWRTSRARGGSRPGRWWSCPRRRARGRPGRRLRDLTGPAAGPRGRCGRRGGLARCRAPLEHQNSERSGMSARWEGEGRGDGPEGFGVAMSRPSRELGCGGPGPGEPGPRPGAHLC